MEVKKEIEVRDKYGDGVSWFRGSMIGKGSFGCVYLAILKNPILKHSYFPSIMAVKSAEVSVSGSIQKEREVFSNVKGCPNIIKCLGEEITMGDNGVMVYNLLLEYGSGGTLADRIKKFGGKSLPEFEVKVYANCILRGLNHIHGIGYVHCDLKPDNILLVSNARRGRGGVSEFRAKIGDFGLAKRRTKQSMKRKLEPYWRGTPMYLSPEAVVDHVQEAPCDIWALGCIVLEMLTGQPPWEGEEKLNADDILRKIGEGNSLPKIPNEISQEARDFLKGCFVRKTVYRWTAEMLLNHPFVEFLDNGDEVEELEDEESLNEIKPILLVTECDDEFSCDLSPDEWGFSSEEDSLVYFSREDAENVDDEIVSSFSEGKLKMEEFKGGMISSTDAGFDQSIKKSIQISSEQFPQEYSNL
ncbi:unnamed protein product [Fraxinus pennsylvanica]|uniref:Protein kinase domain-containing protein n=1 Tax=Fraxinus pennsylvanica TaxID=56036 RepID=A0AAD1YNH8_9LAMI|nr:unnamed protein product [Fraxinus pennsylvanica]